MIKVIENIETKCFLIIPTIKELQPLIDAIRVVTKEVGVKITTHDFPKSLKFPIAEVVSTEIARSDLVIADISHNEPNTLYEVGLAHAMGKFVAFIYKDGFTSFPTSIMGGLFISYDLSIEGLDDFKNRIRKTFEEFIRYPRRFRPFISFPTKLTQPQFIIDFEKLNPREFENLNFELIAQMGFKRVEWGKEFREIDVIATYPKKDPDGYEYQELWLISMGRRAPVEAMFEMATTDPEHFLRRILHYPEGLQELFFKYKIRSDGPITILMIMQKSGPQQEYFDYELRRMDRRIKERPYPISVRVRWWDLTYLTNLVQQYPQIAYKYFSEEARVKSKYRKTPEEMYEENVFLNERLQIALNTLEEEKKRRFIAERNAAWKDVAFKAAHKLGNPIDAIDTFLQVLKKRLENKLIPDSLQITNDIEVSIEESKSVVEQFKSLTKAQEINLKSLPLRPIIDHACKIANENDVKVIINQIDNCPPIMADPDRLPECFNELVANSLHWFDKQEKILKIKIEKPSKRELPDVLDKTQGYLKVTFEDNGCGIPLENKEKIFAPFFTTYAHGTGLGLSLVKTIIDGHGGLIWEDGIPKEGASFKIFLPIAKKSRGK